jgi:hypothetical protein
MSFRSLTFAVVSGLLALLIFVNISLSVRNQNSGERVSKLQQKMTEGRQKENVLRQLTVRIAQGSESDPQLRDILVRRELKASLMVNGKMRDFP